jgi:hypothetical protein
VDGFGGHIPGAHHEALHETPITLRTGYQVYENVSDGTPVSPVFPSADELIAWLRAQGISREAVEAFLREGFAPSFVINSDGGVVSGIESAKLLRED